MIYISSDNANLEFDHAAYLANLADKVAQTCAWCVELRKPWETVLVCHWSACETLTWADRLLRVEPLFEEMPVQYRLAIEWLSAQPDLKYRIVQLGDRTRVEVQAPKAQFLSAVISRFNALRAAALESRANAPRFESGKRQTDVNALVVDWHDCFRTFKQRILRQSPLEENMPEHAKWVLDWLRGEGYEFEFAPCGGFQGRPVKWGVFVAIQ